MSRATKADDFLQNMREDEPKTETPPPVEVTPRQVKAQAKSAPSRNGLKYILAIFTKRPWKR